MKKYTKDEIKAGSKFVPIDEVHMNDWNPKVKRSEEYYKVRQSVEVNGQVMPVIVRNAKSKDFKYEILDGEQRYTAMQELGFDEIWIVNLGDVPDAEAKSTTVWMEQAVPFDDNLLGELLVELRGEVELPYTDEEIDLIAGVMPETQTDDDDEGIDFEQEFSSIKLVIYSQDLKELKDVQQDIVDKHTDLTKGIDKGAISWALLKLATMDETQELLKQLIDTKVKLNKTAEETDESNN